MPLYNPPGNGNCGYDSIAAALLDLYLQGALNQVLQTGHLDALLALYQQQHNQPLQEDLRALSTQQALQKLSPVLREYAVNVVESNPINYHGAFANVTEGTHPSNMRKPGTWIDATYIAALTQSMGIPAIVADNKTMRLHLNDDYSLCRTPISLRLVGKHYYADISNSFARQIKAAQQPTVEETKPDTAEDFSEEERLFAIIEAQDTAREKSTKQLLENLNPHDKALIVKKIFEAAQPKSDYLKANTSDLSTKNLIKVLSKETNINREFDIKQHLEVAKAEIEQARSNTNKQYRNDTSRKALHSGSIYSKRHMPTSESLPTNQSHPIKVK